MDHIPERFLKPEFHTFFDASSQTETRFSGFPLRWHQTAVRTNRPLLSFIHILAVPIHGLIKLPEPGTKRVVVRTLRIVFQSQGEGISTKHSTCGGTLHLFWMNYLSTQSRSSGNWQNLEFGVEHHDLQEMFGNKRTSKTAYWHSYPFLR